MEACTLCISYAAFLTAWWSFPGWGRLAWITGDHYDWRLASSCLLWCVKNSFIGATLTFCRSNAWCRAVAPLLVSSIVLWSIELLAFCHSPLHCPGPHGTLVIDLLIDGTLICPVGKILGIVSWQPEDWLASGIMFL